MKPSITSSEEKNKRNIYFKKITSKNEVKMKFLKLMKRKNKKTSISKDLRGQPRNKRFSPKKKERNIIVEQPAWCNESFLVKNNNEDQGLGFGSFKDQNEQSDGISQNNDLDGFNSLVNHKVCSKVSLLIIRLKGLKQKIMIS